MDALEELENLKDKVRRYLNCGSHPCGFGLRKELLKLVAIDLKAPIPELQGTFPVVMYFANEVDREEFIEAVKEIKPNMKTRSL